MAKATILSLNGNAVIVGPDGTARAAKVGDVVQKGETLRTAAGARVELLMDDGQILAMGPAQAVRVDETLVQTDATPTSADAAVQPQTVEQITQILEQGGDLTQELEAAAAGAAGGTGGDGSSFVRLLRITEGVDPLAYDYQFNPEGPIDAPLLTADVPPATEPPATEPPATEPPATEPPATEPPATEPPATEPPATEPPATEPPATEPPATEPPATEPPATEPPATEPPATQPPVTQPPVSEPPVTPAPVQPVLGPGAGTVHESSLNGQSGQNNQGTQASESFDSITGTIVYTPGNSGNERLQIQDKDGKWVDVTSGGVVEGQYGRLTVTVSGGNYTFSYELSGAVNHDKREAGGGDDGRYDDDTLPESFPMQAISGSGNVSSEIRITITDDGPSVDRVQEAELPVLQQTDAGTAAGNGPEEDPTSGEFKAAFQVIFGADGPKMVLVGEGAEAERVADGMRYGLRFEEGAGTGLKATLTDSEIKLYPGAGGVVQGRDAEGNVIFTLSIDDKTGVVTFDQVGAIKHAVPDGAAGGADELQALAAGAISVVAKATDGDMDTAENTFDLGGRLVFGDDVPLVKLEEEAELPVLQQTDAGTAAGNGPEEDPTSGEFKAAFQVIFGADGPKMVLVGEGAEAERVADGMRYGLRFEEGAGTGLKATLTDSEIKLYPGAGGVVQGRDAEGNVIFTLSIDDKTGVVTFDQVGAIKHAVPDGAAGGADELQALAAGAISVVAKATDGDMDTAENTFDLGGRLVFGDDVPKLILGADEKPVGLQRLDLEEESVKDAKGNVVGNNEADGLGTQGGGTIKEGVIHWGADTFGGVAKATVGGTDYDPAGGVITVRFGVDGKALPSGSSDPVGAILTIQATGSDAGKYTLEVVGALQHGSATHTDLYGLDKAGRDAAMQAAEDWLALSTITLVGQDKDGDRIQSSLKYS
ncbi:hypothetical protein Tfont_02672 [Tepidimonas fonticaldi]|uniref:DUF5801 domain-containing protein n=1 Tax=Tepidimonas fonticaldi TaxID=1101373 RepID=A0A554XF03_9BURK|nr:retention module-containing protein [Tepidimonas fonticaldi]TSE34405.1 hypothetical protein Tfont_02672 [Tepidimonas fonticaldi]